MVPIPAAVDTGDREPVSAVGLDPFFAVEVRGVVPRFVAKDLFGALQRVVLAVVV
ncbi:hypothetical protein [Halomicrobium sp. LC1Hm]|uniref:hypothetical protein n=1 Tax=Halomicrobium sp. LC1Hm TaxID=2610902 RepID=UPI0012AAB9E7|nr:hypothetical protein LC1Hm_3106 [Halomicrobium sp. LC1Hm]